MCLYFRKCLADQAFFILSEPCLNQSFHLIRDLRIRDSFIYRTSLRGCHSRKFLDRIVCDRPSCILTLLSFIRPRWAQAFFSVHLRLLVPEVGAPCNHTIPINLMLSKSRAFPWVSPCPAPFRGPAFYICGNSIELIRRDTFGVEVESSLILIHMEEPTLHPRFAVGAQHRQSPR